MTHGPQITMGDLAAVSILGECSILGDLVFYGASKFGVEREIRAEFEACAGHNRSKFEFKIGDELPKPERMSESALGEKCRKKIALTS